MLLVTPDQVMVHGVEGALHLCSIVLYSIVWYGMVWYGIAMFVSYGIAYGMVW